MSSTDIGVIYDGCCAVCRAFAHRLRLQDSARQIALVDARADPEQRRVLAGRRIDLEAGMGLADRLAVWCFGTRRRAELSYPLFRAWRRLLLFAL